MNKHFRWEGSTLILNCLLQPKASQNEIVGLQADRLKIRITAAPTKGKANNHLIKFISAEFAVTKTQVAIVAGEQSRHKTLRITSPIQIPLAAAIEKQP